ncbi:alpha/beta fold hydrolase [Streptomyces lydicus]|uniref:alpha/beta fold hydrolase n=1 Tax=Streptomyces lydicus TaxID=47763 RepID=UPI0036FD3B36
MTMPPGRTIPLRAGLDLEVREAGTGGSPVLVLHGGPGPSSIAALIDHLASDHRVGGAHPSGLGRHRTA